MRLRLHLLQWSFQVVLLAVFLAPGARALGQSAHEARLVEGAKKEGGLVWYTAMSVDTAKPLVDAFERRYPFVKVRYIRAGTAQMINRVVTETLAGRWEFDAVTVLGMDALVRRNLFTPYFSPEREAFFDFLKDPAGRWHGLYHNHVVLAYNTRLVPEKEAPRDYPDLLNPKWKGKIGMDSRDYTWFGTLVHAWGRDRAVAYMKQLARQEPQFRTGHALIAQHVVAGEFPLGWVYSFRVETMKKEGAPIEWVATFDPIVVEIGGIALSARAKNPSAAKLFIDFVLSRDGQRVILASQRIPSRKDMQTPGAKADQSRLKVRPVPDEVEENLKQYAAEYRELFQIK
ncbi:MAG TPA: extracellular solute-binding protein [candidate division Zixibacteria bacterium]|nr:extracellular solute-binding protein [candidate division Zixibacteria bacterium]